MVRHLSAVDEASAAEHAALLDAFEWAVDVMGILPDERASLIRAAIRIGVEPAQADVDLETTARHLVAIAGDLQALLGDEDEIREWMRSENPGLWTTASPPVRTTPLRVMLDYDGGIKAIRVSLGEERRRKCCPGWNP